MAKMAVIIAAGGIGSRFGAKLPKQFLDVDSYPMIVRSMLPFVKLSQQFVVILPVGFEEYFYSVLPDNISSSVTVALGGKNRYESVKNGLAVIADDYDLVAVHDAARPFVTEELVKKVMNKALESGAAVPVVPLVDSIRRIYPDGLSVSRERANYGAVQTPQIFSTSLLKRAYRQSYSPKFTDDASIVESLGERVYVVDGETSNRKVTYRGDLV